MGQDDDGELENAHLIEDVEEQATVVNEAHGQEQDEEDDDLIGFDDFDKSQRENADEIEMEDESVRALTLKDEVDYENPQMQSKFAPGYTGADDLNNDGIIDALENQIKIMGMKDDIRDIMDEKIKEDYLKKFRKEVDFHHKVAYRFEKAYRLGKNMTAKKKSMNMEIIEIISEHSDYIEQDPLALFYCLYFCIYYKNPDLVEFLRTLIKKMDNSNKPEKIDKLLNHIDQYGIDVLRTQGEKMNTFIYHMVFYQAVDDELRVVYA